jgi:hypothetical protein
LAGLLIALALPLAGCHDEPAGPGDQGRMDALVVDDAQSGAPAIAGRAGQELAVDRSITGRAAFTGSAQGDFRASISVDGLTWVDLGSLKAIAVDLQTAGGETSIHGEQSVPVGTYSHVRLIIEGANAELSAGSVIGAITLGVDTFVSVNGGGPVVIELAVTPFTIGTDANARLVFDLNSEAWLTESALTLGSATATEVQTNVAAGVSMTPS